jgi:hypothetical protein
LQELSAGKFHEVLPASPLDANEGRAIANDEAVTLTDWTTIARRDDGKFGTPRASGYTYIRRAVKRIRLYRRLRCINRATSGAKEIAWTSLLCLSKSDGAGSLQND